MAEFNTDEIIASHGYVVFDCTLPEQIESMAKYSTVLICNSGTAVIEINMLEYTVDANACVLVPPAMIVRAKYVSDDFSATMLQTSQETSMSSFIGLETEMFNVIYCDPCFTISDRRELTLMHNMLDNLRIFMQLPASSHKKDFIYGSIHCIFIVVYDIRLRMTLNAPPHNATYTSADNYFRRFLGLIKENCRTHHDVAFYADKLHITPKYLNEISRKKAHFTAKEIITQFIVTLIKRELLISGNSVQRIAYDYNFCDQSSLGKFFKKATGMSPIAYRRTR